MNTRTLFTSFSPPPFSLTVHHKIHQRITPQHHQQQSNATFQRSFVHTIPHRVSNRHSQPQRHKRHQCQPHLDKNNIKTKRKKQPVRPSWSLYSSTMVNDGQKKKQPVMSLSRPQKCDPAFVQQTPRDAVVPSRHHHTALTSTSLLIMETRLLAPQITTPPANDRKTATCAGN